jgi:hypothetical protein
VSNPDTGTGQGAPGMHPACQSGLHGIPDKKYQQTIPVSGSLNDCVEKDGTFYKTKDATQMEFSTSFFVQRTQHSTVLVRRTIPCFKIRTQWGTTSRKYTIL